MKLINQAKKLPDKPGVYFFLNKKGKILYIGRATSLRKRVASYFPARGGQAKIYYDPRKRELIKKSVRIKYKKTDTVLESIFLEANLIKKYWPKYNVKERDNRSFVYIVIPKIDYPYPMLVRERELEKFSPRLHSGQMPRVFGPYQSSGLIRNALRIIRRIFPYSTCLPAGRPARPNSGKPCFNYQIGLCPGVCVGKISKQEYRKNISNIISLLEGEKKNLLKRLEKENPEKIKNLEHIQDVALISRDEMGHLYYGRFNRIEGYDISHLTGKEPFGSMVVFTNGEPDKNEYRLFKIRTAKKQDDLGSLKETISRRLRHREWAFPDLIVVDGGKPQVDAVFSVLKENFVNIPLIGISKLANDKLVFPKNIKKSIKELIQSIKITILRVRNESHRFANSFSRKQRRKNANF